MAKAMAKEAGVPFFFVSSSAFQSMYYGQTNRKIRSYFKELRKAARAEGGAIGFIEEIDAIAASRSGMRMTGAEGVPPPAPCHRRRAGKASPASSTSCSSSCSRSTTPTKMRAAARLRSSTGSTTGCPTTGQLRKRRSTPANVLVIGATNRAADLDPALLRPGRFDRSIHFDLPSRSGRREIIDYYLDQEGPRRRARRAATAVTRWPP